MNKSSKPPPKRDMTVNDWLEVLTLLGIGVILIIAGISAGWNIVGIILGLAFAGSSVLGTPRIRDFIHITYKSVRGEKVSQVTQRDVSESAVIGGDVHGDVIINPGAKPLSAKSKEQEAIEPERTEPESGTNVLVDEAVIIQPKDTKEYKIVLKKGQLATIEAGADYPITVELISQTEILKSDKRHRKTIEVEKSRTEVRNAKIEYEAKRNGTWFVHIHNDQKKLPLEVGVIISVE